MKIVQAQVKPDPTGTLTITLTGITESGRVCIGHVGGVQPSKVTQETNRLISLLNSAQADVSTFPEGS